MPHELIHMYNKKVYLIDIESVYSWELGEAQSVYLLSELTVVALPYLLCSCDQAKMLKCWSMLVLVAGFHTEGVCPIQLS